MMWKNTLHSMSAKMLHRAVKCHELLLKIKKKAKNLRLTIDFSFFSLSVKKNYC